MTDDLTDVGVPHDRKVQSQKAQRPIDEAKERAGVYVEVLVVKTVCSRASADASLSKCFLDLSHRLLARRQRCPLPMPTIHF